MIILFVRTCTPTFCCMHLLCMPPLRLFCTSDDIWVDVCSCRHWQITLLWWNSCLNPLEMHMIASQTSVRQQRVRAKRWRSYMGRWQRPLIFCSIAASSMEIWSQSTFCCAKTARAFLPNVHWHLFHCENCPLHLASCLNSQTFTCQFPLGYFAWLSH